MLRKFLQNKIKPYIDGTKILKKLAFFILVLFCCSFVFSLNKASTSAEYTLADKGSLIVPGVLPGGNCTIYPVTHPVFIVQLYKTDGGMTAEPNGFTEQAKTIESVIPYASKDALWLCSNFLSDYLIRQNFQTPEQVYLARKSSLSVKSMNLSGGKNDKESLGRIINFSEYKTTEPNKDFSSGIFYNTLLEYYVADNRNFKALASDSKLTSLLSNPSAAQLKYSMELWSYITEVNAQGSDAKGWVYTIDTRPKIDRFLQMYEKSDGDQKGDELYKAGLRRNNWATTSLKQITSNKYTITLGESFNLRYLDLLMTLNTIANNKDYWKKGINGYLTETNGISNICITSGVVMRTTNIATQGGEVKPATVFEPCNDVTQVAYRVEANYNLSDRKASETVYNKVQSTRYLDRLKKAVALSQSNTFYHTAVYDSAVITRIIAERVTEVVNNKLVWGSSSNNTSISKFLKFQVDGKEWEGANWVLEPPLTSSVAVNYQVVLKVDSANYNKLKNKTGPSYQLGPINITLKKLKDLFAKEIENKQTSVQTKDDVHTQVTLEALTVKDGATGTAALTEWKNFITQNSISAFQVKIILSRTILAKTYIDNKPATVSQSNNDTKFTPVPQSNREFPQKYSGTNEWCTSTTWVSVTADDLQNLLQGKKTIGEWIDNATGVLKIADREEKDVTLCSQVYIQYKAQNGKWYYLTGKEGNTTDTLSISDKGTTIADIRQSNNVAIGYTWLADSPPPPDPSGNTIDYPSDTWSSDEPSLAYAELKEGSIYNETFEAMAGVPTTRTLYFSSGGNEFMADLQVNYEANGSAVRKYTSHFNGNECEFKTGDQAKAYTVPPPSGAGSSKLTVNVHDGDVTVTATWTGDIPNKATAKTVTAKHDATATCPAIPDRTAYEAAKTQAGDWATILQGYSISYTAASDGKTRKVSFSNARITGDSPVDPVTTTASDHKDCSQKDPTYDSEGKMIDPGIPCGNEIATAIAEPAPSGRYTITVTASIPAHVICGPCCQHDLPAISDTWTQYITYDTIDITKCKVYKLQNGYVTGMDEITYNSDENVIASITENDPNIFYNIAAYNSPSYSDNKVLTNASRIGRIRYTLQEAQGDDVYYEEMASGVTKRTSKCDGLASTVCTSNPIPAGGKGHNETYATGCLYTNTAFKNEERKNIATTGTKNVYNSETDAVDLKTEEWQRFWQRRNQSVTATVISDMLILQTSSGDQSPIYYAENSTAKAQENFPTLRAAANGSTSIKSNSDTDKALKDTQDSINSKWAEMWTNNPTSFDKVVSDGINVGSYNGKYNAPTTKYQGTGNGAVIATRFDKDATVFSSAKDELGLAQVGSKQSFLQPAYGSGNIASPGKSQARMERVTNLRISVDKIKQKPTNRNKEYYTGQSYVYYLPILKYSLASDNKTGSGEGLSGAFEEKESDILKAAGYKYGPGLIYQSKYSAYNDNSDYKVNNIVTLDGVSVQNAMIVKSEVEDQRTKDGIVKDAMDTLSALEKCPGTPELCEYRSLNCKYTLDTESLSFDFEDKIYTAADSEDDGPYSPYAGQIIKNNLVNSDGAHTSFELPSSMTLMTGDSMYSGFGTGQMVKISGTGSRMTFPYNDCQVTINASSRVRISADVYLPSTPSADTMLFSTGGVGLYIRANSNSLAFITSTGQSRAAAVNIIGKKVKIETTFSLGSLYDCELSVDGVKAVSQITTGLTDAQITAAAINEDMRGSGLNIGCWNNDNNYGTNFYIDNVVITRCGGTLNHTASCYTTYKENDYFFQNLYNGLQTTSAATIDWAAKYDDGTYGNTSTYSKHVHSSSCLTIDSKGYQIALTEAKNGDWTSLKKELGTTLFNMVVSKFDIDTNNIVVTGTAYNFAYTGNSQTFSVPKTGKYTFEVWGAQASGSYAGLGGYTKGTYSLTAGQTVYIYVGGQYGFNGGGTSTGNGGGSVTTYGGGASDIRVGGTTLSNRVIVAGGGGGGNYNGSWYAGIGGNYPYASYSLGQGEGYSHGCSNYVGAGGGGYYGGAASSDGASAGAQGGSGYIGGLTDGTMSSGVRAGNGAVTITSIKTFPDDNELFAYIKANMNLIPDTVTTDKATIINPIWNCKDINNTGESYTEKTVLSCTEPHHFGSHYDFSSTICWDPCNRDENHKKTITEVFNANGTKVEQATYVTLDNFFKVYFPNTGDFYGDGSYGLLQTSINRGKGYIQNMDTTEWTREKYVKFDFDVLYERNGVWENYTAGNWIPLEIIDKSTTKTYTLDRGILDLNGNRYVFDTANNLMSYNGGSTTLVEGGRMAVIDGKIFVLNGNGTVSVSSPYQVYNFYCLLENNEASCIEAQFATEAINYDDQSSIEDPYTGNGNHEEEFDIYAYGNTFTTNRDRFGNLTSHYTARKLSYLDIIGRIGNLIVEDTDDIRFSNYFKKPTATNNDDWIIQGIVSKVDCSISENYLSWHRNSAGYPLAVDVRGEQVSEKNGYYNTWGAQEWTTKAGSSSMGLSSDKNSNGILQAEQQKLGYNVLFDITTMGDYNRYLQVIPYFYALNKRTNELTPVDVYINENGNTKPINYFGLYSEYMDSDGNNTEGYKALADKLYKYTMYLNWTDESARRNYTLGGLESKITDAVRDYFIEDICNSEGELVGYKYLTVPFGNYYNEGTMQCLQPGLRARTFVGTSQVTAIKGQSARLGITSNGINGGIETNIEGAYLAEMFNHQAQRWHLKMGLPSSAIFSAYREKGIHVEPEEDWYVASYTENGNTKTKQFSKAYLTTNVSNKEYGIGSTFLISGVQYTIMDRYKAGTEFNNNNDYVILMTADIKAIGDVWNLKYSAGNDNGNITIDGKDFSFGSNIPTFIAAYDTVSSLVDISTQNTH